MKKKISLSESELVKLIQNVIKENEVEKVFITPQEYIQYLKQVGFMAHAIPYLPKFRGKKLVVGGYLDLSKVEGKQKIYKLGDIEIEGNLNVSNTNIQSLDDVLVKGHKTYWNTPYEKVIERRKLQKKYQEQEERREEDEWNVNNTGYESVRANAVFEYAVSEGYLQSLDDDDKERVNEIKSSIEELERIQENLDPNDEDLDYGERFDEIQDEIDELENELNELTSDKVDVYDLYPIGSHYSLQAFESLSEKMSFAVGNYTEADNSLEDYYEDMVDNANDYFSNDYLSNYIDEEKVKEYYRDSIEEWVRDDPENYNVKKELSSDQEDEIWLLKMEKWVYMNEGVRAPISEPTKEEGNIFDFTDEEDNRFQYKNTSTNSNTSHWVLYKNGQVVPPHQIYDDEDTEEEKETRERRIFDIDYEIEEIEDNPDGDWDEDDIEAAIEDYLDNEIGYDPAAWLRNMGADINDFIDTSELLDDLVRNGEYGSLSSYDDSYDTIDINGTDYVVMRID